MRIDLGALQNWQKKLAENDLSSNIEIIRLIHKSIGTKEIGFDRTSRPRQCSSGHDTLFARLFFRRVCFLVTAPSWVIGIVTNYHAVTWKSNRDERSRSIVPKTDRLPRGTWGRGVGYEKILCSCQTQDTDGLHETDSSRTISRGTSSIWDLEFIGEPVIS